jgi:hypothetical protein
VGGERFLADGGNGPIEKGAMRIEADQMIAGFPAVAVRQLMRETIGRQISVRWVTEVLKCSEPMANRVLSNLQREGFVTSVAGHLEPSLKGSTLAQATAAKPLLRSSAERLVPPCQH